MQNQRRKADQPVAELKTALAQSERELAEAREREAATANILKIISSSPGNLQPVFDAIAQSAARLLGAHSAAVTRVAGDDIHLAAFTSGSEEAIKAVQASFPSPISSSGIHSRVVRSGEPVFRHDIESEADVPQPVRDLARARGYRSILVVPMVRGNEAIGTIGVTRPEPGPFSNDQIALLKSFAAQAVIAIENVRLFDSERERTRELSEALEHQTAASEVLNVISRSPADAQPVFEAIVESATRLCDAVFSVVYLYDNERLRIAATKNFTAEATNQIYERQELQKPNRTFVGGRAVLDRALVLIPDVLEDQEYSREFALAGGWRAVLAVPLLCEGKPVGAITVGKAEPNSFSEQQIQLLKTFADQAVIAIENVRLFNEIQEALEQQTATSEVLKVISSSPGELEPVFNAMLENATRICGAKFGTLYLHRGDAFFATAFHNAPPAFIEARKNRPLHPAPDSTLGRAARTKQVAQILDSTKGEAYRQRDPFVVAGADLGGYRTIVSVPMLKEEELVGVISIYRQEVQAFSDKQIELVKNFASQAVIAIENARLLNELRESLEQQTATADVLKVISRSAFNLQTVLDTLVESAARLCNADSASIHRPQGEAYPCTASYGLSPEFQQYLRDHPIASGRGSVLGRVVSEGKMIHVPDVLADAEHALVEQRKLGGYRTVLGVPLSREGEAIGLIRLTRNKVQPFTDKQIELATTFADQAVIAIENTRLLNELRESLQQQTATADVLKVISRSTFDLKTVLNTLVESAARLCDADMASINRENGAAYQQVANYGHSPELQAYMDRHPIPAGRGSVVGRTVMQGKIIHIPDVLADPDYKMTGAATLGGIHTMLGVPLLREGTPIGVIVLQRKAVRPFTEKQIELVETFADQAVIAIENVRLFESVEARTRELAASLEDLRTTQDRLVQTQKLASLGQLTAGIAHEIKNPLNFVNNFSVVSGELIDELKEALQDVSLNEKRRSEITELMDTLRGNLDKVVQHGKRADAIVKNMLLHSREGSGEHRVVDINAIVEESLNLAYHGARAEKQGFNIRLERSFDPMAGEADLFPQEITRALLNLISNGFYAATKRRAEANGGNYEPTLAAATKNLEDRVEITIRDNGTGVPPDVKEKMFNPFFTTKPAGEGTGLGLSISHDIIVKQHGGSIEVATEPGEFTEIRIILPRAGALLPERSG